MTWETHQRSWSRRRIWEVLPSSRNQGPSFPRLRSHCWSQRVEWRLSQIPPPGGLRLKVPPELDQTPLNRRLPAPPIPLLDPSKGSHTVPDVSLAPDPEETIASTNRYSSWPRSKSPDRNRS